MRRKGSKIGAGAGGACGGEDRGGSGRALASLAAYEELRIQRCALCTCRRGDQSVVVAGGSPVLLSRRGGPPRLGVMAQAVMAMVLAPDDLVSGYRCDVHSQLGA